MRYKRVIALISVAIVIAIALLLWLPYEVVVEKSGRLSITNSVVLASPGWVSPTGFVDGGGVWTNDALAYDENTGTFAYADSLKRDWADYLELTVGAIDCDKVQVWVDHTVSTTNSIEIDVYYSSGWHNIHSGTPASWGAWNEYPIGSTQSVTAMRIRVYATKALPNECQIVEADFNEVTATPDISNLPTSKAFGVVSPSTSYWSNGGTPVFPLDDGECYFEVTNNSGAAVDITIKGTNFTGGVGWTLASSSGENIVVLKAGKSGDALEGNMVILTTSEQGFISTLADTATKKWELKLETGTYTDGDEKTSIVTLTATIP